MLFKVTPRVLQQKGFALYQVEGLDPKKEECSLSNSSGNWLNDEFVSVEDYSLNAVTEKTIIMYIFIFLEMAKELGQQLPTCKFCKDALYYSTQSPSVLDLKLPRVN